jgi:hypothetical protein
MFRRDTITAYKIMKKIIAFIIIILCGLTGCYLSNNYINIAKITIKVIDEKGLPIQQAKVALGFFVGGVNKVLSVKGLADINGRFTGSSESISEIGINVSKDGYYSTYQKYHYQGFKYKRWLPWNPEIQIVLCKIGNRVPMYAHDTQYSKIEIPVIGKKIGFDLIAFDWVHPYGKGIHPDLIFKLDKSYKGLDNFKSKLTISFSNRYDGIQIVKQEHGVGSSLRLARFAPEDGYQKELTHYNDATPKNMFKNSFSKDNNYFFRVRSEVKNDKLIRAMYGMIYGDIVFAPSGSKTAKIIFKYFINPDYTRNMEFDPKRNLFTGLSDLEQNGLQ